MIVLARLHDLALCDALESASTTETEAFGTNARFVLVSAGARFLILGKKKADSRLRGRWWE